jgi:sRNA-binding protein
LPQFRRRASGDIVNISISTGLLVAVLCVPLAGAAEAGAQGQKEPDVVVLTGSPLGGVTFTHKVHTKDHGAKCETCHHASRPEKPLKSDRQKCTDCHTKVATAPMKTKTQAAFHDPMAKKGVCIDCHTAAAAKGKAKVPVKCGDCHKKANA